MRRGRTGARAFLTVLCVSVLLVVGLMALENALAPTLLAMSEAEVARVTTRVLVETINVRIASMLDGKELLEFKTNEQGDLLYVKANARELSELQAEALDVLEEAFKNLEGIEIAIPLGQALGSTIFAPNGPKVRITLFPYGTVQAQIRDSFDVTGINQVRYNVNLHVTCTVRVVIPLITSKTTIESDIPVASVFIPGKVPNTYLELIRGEPNTK